MKTGKKIIFLVVLVLLILPSITHAVSWLPLVPCGTSVNPTPCNRCDLLKLLKNIIDFVLIGLMPPVAAILFVWGGFLILMGGANPGWITQGKSIFWNTAIGIAIILASWLITNSIIRSLAVDNVAPEWWKFECRVTTGEDDGAVPLSEVTLSVITTSLSNATVGQLYVGQLEVQGGMQPYRFEVSDDSLPGGLLLNSTGGDLRGTPTTAGTYNFTVKVTDNSTPQQSATKQLSIVVGGTGTGEVACLQSNLNLCQAQLMNCKASACNQYTASINKYAGGAASANLLKAIMIKESACNVNATSGFDSFGLMQLRPATANIYKSRCGVTANVTGAWLTTPANADASICIAAEYIKALAQTSCGNNIRGIAAGYNGGSGACNNSSDCATENSCAGGPKKRWECLYDNPQHTVCNGGNNILDGYNQTRDYVVKVLYCYNNPGF